VTDSIPYAQEEMDINMRHKTRQRRVPETEKAEARYYETKKRKVATGNIIEETPHGPNVQLAGFSQRQVQFLWRLPCRVQSFAFNVTGQKANAIAKNIAQFARGK
jgi:hypothetical protein